MYSSPSLSLRVSLRRCVHLSFPCVSLIVHSSACSSLLTFSLLLGFSSHSSFAYAIFHLKASLFPVSSSLVPRVSRYDGLVSPVVLVFTVLLEDKDLVFSYRFWFHS